MADMATIDAAFGLIPYGEMKGAHMYSVITATTYGLYHGDLVEYDGQTLVTPHMGNLREAILEATGAAGSILGAVIGCFDEDMKPCLYIAAGEVGNSTIAGYVLVADHPDQEFLIQEDGDTSSIIAADIGLNVEAIDTTAGSNTTGRSGMELDSTSKATTISHALKILGVHPEDTMSTGAAAGTYCRFIVKVNSHANGHNVVGV